MHTVKVIGAGLGLLALCLLTGRAQEGKDGMRKGTVAFLPMWFAGTGLNLYFGVRNKGYSISEELPVAAGVFGIPALVAFELRRRLR